MVVACRAEAGLKSYRADIDALSVACALDGCP